MLDVTSKMKYIYILCLALILINCNNGLIYREKIIYPDVSRKVEQDTVIVYERTGCYGICPVYRIIIFGNGDVYYTGINHVKTVGNRHNIISKKNIDRIIQKFNEMSYFELRTNFPDEIESNILMVTDAATVITSIKLGNKFESISRYIGNEGTDNIDLVKKMKDLEECIEDIVNIRQYIE